MQRASFLPRQYVELRSSFVPAPEALRQPAAHGLRPSDFGDACCEMYRAGATETSADHFGLLSLPENLDNRSHDNCNPSGGGNGRIGRHRISRHRVSRHRVSRHRVSRHRIGRYRIGSTGTSCAIAVIDGHRSRGVRARVARSHGIVGRRRDIRRIGSRSHEGRRGDFVGVSSVYGPRDAQCQRDDGARVREH